MRPSTVSRIIPLIAVLIANGLLAFALLWGALGIALAQDKPPVTPEPGGIRFDVYPHPYSRGALAYSLGDRWNRTDLTFYFHNCPRNIDCETGWGAVREGFRSWADLTVLNFTEVDDPRDADIELTWTTNAPELGWPGDVLAFATFPSDGGDVVFDDAEPWTVYDQGPFDLYMVATHEIGHALGLNHSSIPTALMYPVVTPQTTGLTEDDAAGIQALYGTPDQRPPDQQTRDVAGAPAVEDILVNGEITDTYPYELWEFEAYAGETLTITMTATGGNLSPYLGLLTDDETTLLAESGPAAGGIAQLTYSFDRDGIYVVMATREGVEEGNTTGDYELTLTSGEAAALPTAAPADSDLIYFDIRSYTTMPVCEVYVSPTNDTEWGVDRLPDTLTNGNLLELQVPTGLYDVLVVGCDGTELEEYEVNARQSLAVEIYDNDLNIYVYPA